MTNINSVSEDGMIQPSEAASPGGSSTTAVERQAILTNPQALVNPSEQDEANAMQGELLERDEDLLDDYPPDSEDVDLVHQRIASIPKLNLSRLSNCQKLCLRQNAISKIDGLDVLASTLLDLDLYDNSIGHLNNLDSLVNLTSLDLSYNDLKHIKNISSLTSLKDLYFSSNRIGKIEGLETLTKLRNLELGANKIREIEGLETLVGLEELWLGKNKITGIKNISSLTNLTILSLPSNRLTSITGLEGLNNLTELYISHNALTSISGLDSTPNIRTLDISNNQISKLENLSHLTHLEELWASSNKLSNFREVEAELRNKEELTTVYFEMNPLQLMGPAVYRNKVKLALPQVKQIDATFVTAT